MVVCAYNEQRTLEACLRSLTACRYPGLEVIVCDDGSTDATHEIARIDARSTARAGRPPKPPRHEFIKRLPHGYNTVIDERGTSMSGGERQRVAIARALLTDAPILVLDEPTSALDVHPEAEMFSAIRRLIAGRTTFIISHRLSTVVGAHQIITIDGGRIAEVGTHDRLIAANGLYAALYHRQHPGQPLSRVPSASRS